MKRRNKHCPERKRVVLILKRLPVVFLLAFFMLSGSSAFAGENGPAAMILYEPRTGTVLEAIRPDEPMLIASTTKIMTALVVLERCTLHETVTATQAHTQIEGSSASLVAGETYTVEELLYGLMLASGNDAACALAEHTAGSVECFAALMNEKAAEIGLENTHFVNPHGLNDPEHFSTARDLALLTAAAMENDVFRLIFGTRSFSAHGVDYLNHNKLLDSCEGCLGGKTGYTKAAGRTLVSCCERDGMLLICVTLNDPDDWEDHRSSYDRAFSAFSFIPFRSERFRRIPVVAGTAMAVSPHCGASGVLVHRGTSVETIVDTPRYVFAPVSAGEFLGTVTVMENGRTLCTAELSAAHGVSLDCEDDFMPWKRFLRLWGSRFGAPMSGVPIHN